MVKDLKNYLNTWISSKMTIGENTCVSHSQIIMAPISVYSTTLHSLETFITHLWTKTCMFMLATHQLEDIRYSWKIPSMMQSMSSIWSCIWKNMRPKVSLLTKPLTKWLTSNSTLDQVSKCTEFSGAQSFSKLTSIGEISSLNLISQEIRCLKIWIKTSSTK